MENITFIQNKTSPGKEIQQVEDIVIRFAGDSGDGMQLTGNRFAAASALFGNDIATLPDFPAEIRAPAGTIAGVSGFQVHLSSKKIYTPGDEVDVLVAMNPAALKANLSDLTKNGVVITNEDEFTEENWKKVGYTENPLQSPALRNYRLINIPISRLTQEALKDTGLLDKDIDRSKNMFVLGLLAYLFDRPLVYLEEWIERKFSNKAQIAEANQKALRAGYHYGEITELFPIQYKVPPVKLPPGIYRNVTGNEALSLGIIAAAELSGLKVFLGSYPITPASDILHELSRYKEYPIITFQAEDEIAAACAALGAAYGGNLALCTTSGPGFTLKQETINLAVMAELPIVIANIQRAGPSTGMPTKMEQADLLQALFGRHGESPLIVLAARSPADCFYKILQAFRLATKYMTPVIFLSDGFLANSSEPWRLPEKEELKPIEIHFRDNPENYQVYLRDENTLARFWVRPGTPNLEHRIGGLEKQHISGMVSYDGKNHETMVYLRQAKIEKAAHDIPPAVVEGREEAKTLLISWGSTYGAIKEASLRLEKEGILVAHLHLDYLNPLPKNTETILRKYSKIYVAELNTGMLAYHLQGKYAIKMHKINKVQGKPFKAQEIVEAIKQGEKNHD